jgi:hypothetical protein
MSRHGWHSETVHALHVTHLQTWAGAPRFIFKPLRLELLYGQVLCGHLFTSLFPSLFYMSCFLSHAFLLVLEHSMTRTALGLYSILNFICTAPQPVIHNAGCTSPPSVYLWLCQHLHMPPITSMLPPLSHVLMVIVLVLFLDISCAHNSFLTPWCLTHWHPLTHFV